MANPASHFSLYDPYMDYPVKAERVMDNGEVPVRAERVPDNGSLSNLPPINPQISALQALAIQNISNSLSATPQKGAGGFFDFLRGYPKASAYNQSKRKGQEGIQALNAITGQQNAALNPYFKQDASARGWANIGLREKEGDRSDERIGIAKDRETRLGYGPAIKVESVDDTGMPTTVLGNQLPGGKGILLTDGTIIQPTMFPKGVRITPLQGQNEYQGFNPYTGRTTGTITTPGGEPFRPPLPAGAAENAINTANASGSLEQMRYAFNKYKGSSYPASVQRGLQIGAEKLPGITRDVTSALGMGDEYDRQISFMSEFNRALTDYVNAKSGKQYSYMEFLRFAHLFPNIATDNDTTFENKMSSLMSAIERSYGLTIKLYPGASALIGNDHLGTEADGKTPESIYGDATTNVGGGDDWDAELDRLLGKPNAPKR